MHKAMQYNSFTNEPELNEESWNKKNGTYF